MVFNIALRLLYGVQHHATLLWCSTSRYSCFIVFSITLQLLYFVQHYATVALFCSASRYSCFMVFSITLSCFMVFSITLQLLYDVQHHATVTLWCSASRYSCFIPSRRIRGMNWMKIWVGRKFDRQSVWRTRRLQCGTFRIGTNVELALQKSTAAISAYKGGTEGFYVKNKIRKKNTRWAKKSDATETLQLAFLV